MCEICGWHGGHAAACPFNDDPLICADCGHTIFSGDDYYEINGETVCEECACDMPPDILLKRLGVEKETA